MEIVIGLSLRNLKPRVWDSSSPYYLPQVKAIMVSYAEFYANPAQRRKAMTLGLHAFLGVPNNVKVYLDNGSFSFLKKIVEVPRAEYEQFVLEAKPDWYPTPQDYIPAPMMTKREQHSRRRQTMDVNVQYRHDAYVPVLHVGTHLKQYVVDFQNDEFLRVKTHVALGGIVPNLLRAPKALPYREVLDGLRQVRATLADKHLHVFGIGGTATVHMAALLGMDSIDSSGWRNRAARGIIQLPGRGDRLVAELGKWRGRTPCEKEWVELENCKCPACLIGSVEGLKASGAIGFANRATHNLHVLLQEAEDVKHYLEQGDEAYKAWYVGHVENTTYKPLLEYILNLRKMDVELSLIE